VAIGALSFKKNPLGFFGGGFVKEEGTRVLFNPRNMCVSAPTIVPAKKRGGPAKGETTRGETTGAQYYIHRLWRVDTCVGGGPPTAWKHK